MFNFLSTWDWYIAGPLIGIMIPVLLIFGNKLLGISSAFRHICSMALPKNKIEFLKYDWKQHKWNLFFVIGIAFGGYIAANHLSNGEMSLLPEHFYELEGLIQLFLGGILVGFGTRYAGGCTSGHAIAGLSTFQTSSLKAVVSFFAGGVIMTFIINNFF